MANQCGGWLLLEYPLLPAGLLHRTLLRLLLLMTWADEAAKDMDCWAEFTRFCVNNNGGIVSEEDYRLWRAAWFACRASLMLLTGRG